MLNYFLAPVGPRQFKRVTLLRKCHYFP
jgi:hypothetical protein